MNHVSSLGIVSIAVIASLLLTSSAISVYATAIQPAFSPNPPRNLSSNSGSSEVPVIAVKGSNVYIAWQDDTSTPGKAKTFFRASHDGGVTFGLPIMFLGAGGAHQHRIIAEGASSVYLVWTQTVSHNKEIYFAASHDGGDTFNTTGGINLSNNPAKSDSPVIAAYGNNVYVVWHDETPTTVSQTNNQFYRVSHDGGITFTPAVSLAPQGRESEISVWKNHVYVVRAGHYVRTSHDNGTTFSLDHKVNVDSHGTTLPGVSREPKVAAWENNVYVTWPWGAQGLTPGNYEAMIAVSHNYGDSFLPAFNMSNNVGPSREVEIDAYGTNVYATWRDSSIQGNGINQYVIASHNNGTTFAPYINLSGIKGSVGYTGSDNGFGQVRSFGNNVYVIWAADGPGNDDVFIASSQDSGGSYAVQNLSNSPGPSLALGDPGDEKDIIVAVGNHIYVVWQDEISGNNEIFFTVGTV